MADNLNKYISLGLKLYTTDLITASIIAIPQIPPVVKVIINFGAAGVKIATFKKLTKGMPGYIRAIIGASLAVTQVGLALQTLTAVQGALAKGDFLSLPQGQISQ